MDVQKLAGHGLLSCPEPSIRESQHNSSGTIFSYIASPFHRLYTEARTLSSVSSMNRKASCRVSGSSSFCPKVGIL